MKHQNSNTPYPHQVGAFQSLQSIALTAFDTSFQQLPRRPRTNTLIVGPSGSGKSKLVSIVGEEIGVDVLHITVSEWMPLGASERGAQHTWKTIVEFLLRRRSAKGAILFVDEIDKIGSPTPWDTHVRNELFRLLDLQLPPGLVMETECDGTDSEIPPDWRDEAALMLATRTLIVGAGAFQNAWESKQRTIGFRDSTTESSVIDAAVLRSTLPTELVNRFSSEIIVLPPLDIKSYEQMAEAALEQLPQWLHNTFRAVSALRIRDAVRRQSGARFVEDVLLESLLAEREAKAIPAFKPTAASARRITP